jgi:hypothetical protein
MNPAMMMQGSMPMMAPPASVPAPVAPTPPAAQPQMDPSQPMDTTQRPAEILPPNNTVYVNNLNEKVKAAELKKSLYHVFSPHGKVLEIHAQKLNKLRGQAWIIYEDEKSAVKAVEAMAGYSFYGKPMRVNFARVSSDIISKQNGSFVARPKRKTKSEKKRVKRIRVARKEQTPSTSMVTSGFVPAQAGPVPPNNILFIEELPPQCNAMMLDLLFRQYEGYVEARLVEQKPGIAFVEFSGVAQAAQAKDVLQGFSITPTNQMKITFAKK